MNWQPTTNQETRQLRAQMNHDIRTFFHQRHVLEVETPALSQAGNTDPFIQSFQLLNSIATNNTSRFLHTSPEYPMKRLLAAGSGDIYQICKVWREGEAGRNHNPEFTLLEWYRVDYSVQKLMQEVSDLLHALLPSLEKKDKKFTYEQLFLEKFDLNPHIAKHADIVKCTNTSIPSLETVDLDRQALLDALLTHCIEPDFESDCLTFVYDYPASQSALAKIRERKDKSSVAMRFEVYLGQSELGNGYQEETCYQRNKDILQSENIQRQKLNLENVKQDENFLAAAKSGIPESAGVAIGLDRVLMALSGINTIQKVINFPWDVA
ncbi:MAG: EF-P lysine aminoacylase GenX [Cocleimonas sp.]|nr:EF-P lysine aminoacylase GenX [Cocleimonas sp.]